MSSFEQTPLTCEASYHNLPTQSKIYRGPCVSMGPITSLQPATLDSYPTSRKHQGFKRELARSRETGHPYQEYESKPDAEENGMQQNICDKTLFRSGLPPKPSAERLEGISMIKLSNTPVTNNIFSTNYTSVQNAIKSIKIG